MLGLITEDRDQTLKELQVLERTLGTGFEGAESKRVEKG